MTQQHVVRWLEEHRWFVAAIAVIFGGYAIGKDMALRDNAADRAAVKAQVTR